VIESREYPYLPVTFQVRDVEETIPALVDTGFDGFLVLPEAYLSRLGDPDFVGRWILADGSAVGAAKFRGSVRITGLRELVQASITCLGAEIILGRAIVDHFAVTFDHGRRIVATD
jgi:predicted aspartyl protease